MVKPGTGYIPPLGTVEVKGPSDRHLFNFVLPSLILRTVSFPQFHEGSPEAAREKHQRQIPNSGGSLVELQIIDA